MSNFVMLCLLSSMLCDFIELCMTTFIILNLFYFIDAASKEKMELCVDEVIKQTKIIKGKLEKLDEEVMYPTS